MENLRITESIKENLLTAAKWLKFLTVVSIVGVALVALMAMIIPFLAASQGILLFFVYMAAIAIYIYPIVKCLKIVESTRNAMNNASQVDLETAAASLKSLLKYIGILCVIVLSLYALIFFFAVITRIVLF